MKSLVVHGTLVNEKGFEYKVIDGDSLPQSRYITPSSYLDEYFKDELKQDRVDFRIRKILLNDENYIVLSQYRAINPKEININRGAYIAVSIVTSDKIDRDDTIEYYQKILEVHLDLLRYINEDRNSFKDDFFLENYTFQSKELYFNIQLADVLCQVYYANKPINVPYIKNKTNYKLSCFKTDKENTKQLQICNEEIENLKIKNKSLEESNSTNEEKIENLKKQLKTKEETNPQFDIIISKIEELKNRISVVVTPPKEKPSESSEPLHILGDKKSFFSKFDEKNILIAIVAIFIIIFGVIIAQYFNSSSSLDVNNSAPQPSDINISVYYPDPLIISSCYENDYPQNCMHLGKIYEDKNDIVKAQHAYKKACKLTDGKEECTKCIDICKKEMNEMNKTHCEERCKS